MKVSKIWVRSTGAPVKRPHPETKTKPPIGNTPVQVTDSVHWRQLINHPDEPLEICAPPKPGADKRKTKTDSPKGKE